jgi:hypothetical protein
MNKAQYVEKPKISNWFQGATSIGAFVIPEPEADYRSTIPSGFLPSPMDTSNLIHVDKEKIDVFFRRWIAIRIAGLLKAKNLLENFEYADALEAIAPPSTWTKDAEKALEGLIKEKNQEYGRAMLFLVIPDRMNCIISK